MYRIRYIFAMADVVERLDCFLKENYQLKPHDRRSWIEGILRGLFFKEFFLNIIPNPKVPYVHKDAFGIGIECPWIIQRLHRQVDWRRDLQETYVSLVLNRNNDLYLEYDFRTTDRDVMWQGVMHAPNLPPRIRSHRTGGKV